MCAASTARAAPPHIFFGARSKSTTQTRVSDAPHPAASPEAPGGSDCAPGCAPRQASPQQASAGRRVLCATRSRNPLHPSTPLARLTAYAASAAAGKEARRSPRRALLSGAGTIVRGAPTAKAHRCAASPRAALATGTCEGARGRESAGEGARGSRRCARATHAKPRRMPRRRRVGCGGQRVRAPRRSAARGRSESSTPVASSRAHGPTHSGLSPLSACLRRA